MSRGALITLLLALALGLSAGIYIGWVAAPLKYVDTAPDSLRPAAKDDAILMIATLYAGQADLAAARARLAQLGVTDPGAAVVATARRYRAAQAPASDLRRLAALAAAFNATPHDLQPYRP